MLPCVYPVIDHRGRCQILIRTYGLCATFVFLPHFDVICDQLLNKRTATWIQPTTFCRLNRFIYFSIWFARRASTRKSNFSLFSLETCSPVVVGLNCFQLVRTYRKQVRDVSKSAALTAREPGLDTTEFWLLPTRMEEWTAPNAWDVRQDWPNQGFFVWRLGQREIRVNIKVLKCGLFINQKRPWMHTTPDFLCSCDCRGEDCGEVKFFLLSERIMILIRVVCLNPLLVSKGTALGSSDCSAHMN